LERALIWQVFPALFAGIGIEKKKIAEGGRS